MGGGVVSPIKTPIFMEYITRTKLLERCPRIKNSDKMSNEQFIFYFIEILPSDILKASPKRCNVIVIRVYPG